MTQENKHTPLPYRFKNKKKQFLTEETGWSASYDSDDAPKNNNEETGISTYLPIMAGEKTVALAVNNDKGWEDKTVDYNAKFIVHACNSHYELLEIAKDALETTRECATSRVLSNNQKLVLSQQYVRIEAAIAKAEGK